MVKFPHKTRLWGPPVSLTSQEMLDSSFVNQIHGTIFLCWGNYGCDLKCCSGRDNFQLYSLGPPSSVRHNLFNAAVKMEDVLPCH